MTRTNEVASPLFPSSSSSTGPNKNETDFFLALGFLILIYAFAFCSRTPPRDHRGGEAMRTHHVVVAVSGANETNPGACGKGELVGLTRSFTLGVLIRRRTRRFIFIFLSPSRRAGSAPRLALDCWSGSFD